MSTLDEILAKMNDDAAPAVKTAAEASPAHTPNAEDAALTAVRNATKVAAAPAQTPASTDAVAALHKLAEQTAAREQELMAKQAAEQGAAFCDGFMARLAAYESAFGQSKTASASPVDLEKIAAEAYAKGAADQEKLAAAAYEQGYNETLQQVHKLASDLHLAGQADARTVVQALKQASTSDKA